MWEVDHKESWVPKNWFFWTMVLEKTLESSLDCKEIKLVSPKREWALNIHWKDWCWSQSSNTLPTWCEELTGKDPDAGKDWRQEKGTIEDEMVGWHHWLDGLKFEQSLRVDDGQGILVCCSPWGHKESDLTEQLNWAELRKFTLKWICLDLKCVVGFFPRASVMPPKLPRVEFARQMGNGKSHECYWVGKYRLEYCLTFSSV